MACRSSRASLRATAAAAHVPSASVSLALALLCVACLVPGSQAGVVVNPIGTVRSGHILCEGPCCNPQTSSWWPSPSGSGSDLIGATSGSFSDSPGELSDPSWNASFSPSNYGSSAATCTWFIYSSELADIELTFREFQTSSVYPVPDSFTINSCQKIQPAEYVNGVFVATSCQFPTELAYLYGDKLTFGSEPSSKDLYGKAFISKTGWMEIVFITSGSAYNDFKGFVADWKVVKDTKLTCNAASKELEEPALGKCPAFSLKFTTCAPSVSVTDNDYEGYLRFSSSQCLDSKCTDHDNDCWSDLIGEPFSCEAGYEVQFTNQYYNYEGKIVQRYQCCAVRQVELSNSLCLESKCTSPGDDGTKDCWAGNGEPFSCEEGYEYQLMDQYAQAHGKTWQRYQCCPSIRSRWSRENGRILQNYPGSSERASNRKRTEFASVSRIGYYRGELGILALHFEFRDGSHVSFTSKYTGSPNSQSDPSIDAVRNLDSSYLTWKEISPSDGVIEYISEESTRDYSCICWRIFFKFTGGLVLDLHPNPTQRETDYRVPGGTYYFDWTFLPDGWEVFLDTNCDCGASRCTCQYLKPNQFSLPESFSRGYSDVRIRRSFEWISECRARLERHEWYPTRVEEPTFCEPGRVKRDADCSWLCAYEQAMLRARVDECSSYPSEADFCNKVHGRGAPRDAWGKLPVHGGRIDRYGRVMPYVNDSTFSSFAGDPILEPLSTNTPGDAYAQAYFGTSVSTIPNCSSLREMLKAVCTYTEGELDKRMEYIANGKQAIGHYFYSNQGVKENITSLISKKYAKCDNGVNLGHEMTRAPVSRAQIRCEDTGGPCVGPQPTTTPPPTPPSVIQTLPVAVLTWENSSDVCSTAINDCLNRCMKSGWKIFPEGEAFIWVSRIVEPFAGCPPCPSVPGTLSNGQFIGTDGFLEGKPDKGWIVAQIPSLSTSCSYRYTLEEGTFLGVNDRGFYDEASAVLTAQSTSIALTAAVGAAVGTAVATAIATAAANSVAVSVAGGAAAGAGGATGGGAASAGGTAGGGALWSIIMQAQFLGIVGKVGGPNSPLPVGAKKLSSGLAWANFHLPWPGLGPPDQAARRRHDLRRQDANSQICRHNENITLTDKSARCACEQSSPTELAGTICTTAMLVASSVVNRLMSRFTEILNSDTPFAFKGNLAGAFGWKKISGATDKTAFGVYEITALTTTFQGLAESSTEAIVSDCDGYVSGGVVVWVLLALVLVLTSYLTVHGAQSKLIVFKKTGTPRKMEESKESTPTEALSDSLRPAAALREEFFPPATLIYTQTLVPAFYHPLPPMTQMTVFPYTYMASQPLIIYGSQFGPQGEGSQQASDPNDAGGLTDFDLQKRWSDKQKRRAKTMVRNAEEMGDLGIQGILVRGLTFAGLGHLVQSRGEWVPNEKHPEPEKAQRYYHTFGFAFQEHAHHGWWFQKYRWIHVVINAVIITGVQDPSWNAGIIFSMKCFQVILTVGFLPHVNLVSAITEIWSLLSNFVQLASIFDFIVLKSNMERIGATQGADYTSVDRVFIICSIVGIAPLIVQSFYENVRKIIEVYGNYKKAKGMLRDARDLAKLVKKVAGNGQGQTYAANGQVVSASSGQPPESSISVRPQRMGSPVMPPPLMDPRFYPQ